MRIKTFRGLDKQFGNIYQFAELDSITEILRYEHNVRGDVKWGTGYRSLDAYRKNVKVLTSEKRKIIASAKSNVQKDKKLKELLVKKSSIGRKSDRHVGMPHPLSYHIEMDKPFVRQGKVQRRKSVRIIYSMSMSSPNNKNSFVSLYTHLMMYVFALKALRINPLITVIFYAAYKNHKFSLIYKDFSSFNLNRLFPFLCEQGLLRVNGLGVIDHVEEMIKVGWGYGAPIPADWISKILDGDLIVATGAPGFHWNHIIGLTKKSKNRKNEHKQKVKLLQVSPSEFRERI